MGTSMASITFLYDFFILERVLAGAQMLVSVAPPFLKNQIKKKKQKSVKVTTKRKSKFSRETLWKFEIVPGKLAEPFPAQ